MERRDVSPRILVVDDSPLMRCMLSSFLRARGAEVAEAEAARPALARMEAEPFHLLITDIDMPGPSGLWLLDQARDRWPGLPVILITGGSAPDPPSSADALLLKPFSLHELGARVEEVLERSGGAASAQPSARGAKLRTCASSSDPCVRRKW